MNRNKPPEQLRVGLIIFLPEMLKQFLSKKGDTSFLV